MYIFLIPQDLLKNGRESRFFLVHPDAHDIRNRLENTHYSVQTDMGSKQFRERYLQYLLSKLESDGLVELKDDLIDLALYQKAYGHLFDLTKIFDVSIYGSALLNSMYTDCFKWLPKVRYIPSMSASSLSLDEAQHDLCLMMYENIEYEWSQEQIRKHHPNYTSLTRSIKSHIAFQSRVVILDAYETIDLLSKQSEKIMYLCNTHPTFRFLQRIRGAFTHNFYIDTREQSVPEKYKDMKRCSEKAGEFKTRYNKEYYKNVFWRTREVILSDGVKTKDRFTRSNGERLDNNFFGPIETYSILYDIMDQFGHWIKNYPDTSELLFHKNGTHHDVEIKPAKDFEIDLT